MGNLTGFSLIEVLITTALSSVVGVLLVNLLVANNGVFYSQTAQVSQSLDLNDANSTISNDIKSSIGVATGYPINLPTITSSLNSLVLKIPSTDSSGNTISSTFDYIVISQDPNQPILRQRTYPDPLSSRHSQNKVLVKNLSKINFFYLDSIGNSITPTSSASVTFVLNTQVVNGPSTQQGSSSATISIRNI